MTLLASGLTSEQQEATVEDIRRTRRCRVCDTVFEPEMSLFNCNSYHSSGDRNKRSNAASSGATYLVAQSNKRRLERSYWKTLVTGEPEWK